MNTATQAGRRVQVGHRMLVISQLFDQCSDFRLYSQMLHFFEEVSSSKLSVCLIVQVEQARSFFFFFPYPLPFFLPLLCFIPVRRLSVVCVIETVSNHSRLFFFFFSHYSQHPSCQFFPPLKRNGLPPLTFYIEQKKPLP